MGKSRKEKSEVIKNTNAGAWVLLLMVFICGIAAYFYKEIDDRWVKVLEIVGAPFSLGLGFFVFEKASDMLNDYKKSNKGGE